MSEYSNVEYKNMMINNILSNYKKYPEYGDKVRPLALEVWIKSNDNFHKEIFTFYEIYDEIKKELSINEDDTFNSH